MDKKINFVLICLYLLAIVLRLYSVRNYNFPFWFDNGRDAIVSREILEKKDLKIQGPTASGTGDSVYHGVVYYYLIGPLYTAFAGDPQAVLNILIILSSLAIFAVYGLALELSKSKQVGLLASFFYVTSFDAISANTWFSNPIVASATIPFFFYLIYLVFFKRQLKLLPALALVLALTQQSAILFVTLWGLLAVAFFYAVQDKKFTKKIKFKNLVTSTLVYLLGISSMILAQVKAFRAGIFGFNSLGNSVATANNLEVVWGTVRLIVLKLTQIIFPSLPVLSLIVILFLVTFIFKLKRPIKIYLLLVFASPLFLLSWRYYNMYHSFFGFEALAAIILAWFILSLPKIKFRKFLQLGLIILFLFSNFAAAKNTLVNKSTFYYLPQGACLKDQLALIDYSYQLADGQDFSISSLTNPYGYNTVWSYLYSWYGQKKYGYTPQFYGPSQIALFGEGLLSEAEVPREIHFSIYEPVEGIPVWLKTEFTQSQLQSAGEVVEIKEFGSLKLELR